MKKLLEGFDTRFSTSTIIKLVIVIAMLYLYITLFIGSPIATSEWIHTQWPQLKDLQQYILCTIFTNCS